MYIRNNIYNNYYYFKFIYYIWSKLNFEILARLQRFLYPGSERS